MLCCQTWTAAACPPWLQVTCSCATFAAQQEQMWSSVAGAQANMKGVSAGPGAEPHSLCNLFAGLQAENSH